MLGGNRVGIRYNCSCPDVLEEHINTWFFIYTTNSEDDLFDVQWQLREVGENYIVVRRPVADLGGFQRAVILCSQLVGVVEAPPPVV